MIIIRELYALSCLYLFSDAKTLRPGYRCHVTFDPPRDPHDMASLRERFKVGALVLRSSPISRRSSLSRSSCTSSAVFQVSDPSSFVN